MEVLMVPYHFATLLTQRVSQIFYEVLKSAHPWSSHVKYIQHLNLLTNVAQMHALAFESINIESIQE